MNEKIQPPHRQRAAYVYVRQSTGHQVRHHHQGRQRQYDLATHARELNFARVVVIDDDQGKTGSGLVDRPGFATLLSAVCRGEVGAVFALEASRLARNNRDWHHLIDLCALTETLIVDAEGIYDPRQLNDRLLLGLKGTMSEFELGLFRQRAREAFEMKIQRGHALWEMPVGLIRDEDDRVEKIADRQVQAAIGGVFAKFRELGSARQTALWYRDEKVPLPEAVPGTLGREVVWRLPREGRIHQILNNPSYAGALAHGRTESKVTIEEGRARRATSRRHKPREKWNVLILDNHVGYITWEECLEKARFEVDRAWRQYDAVDPANRLVAGELEVRWNTALERVAELEQQCSHWDEQRVALTEEQQRRLLELGRDLPALWNHAAASVSLKKRILRTVLEEIVIRDDQPRRKHLLALHWKGGVHSELEVPRNATGKKPTDTDRTALELIEELSKVCSDQAIAALLNRLGYKTGAGKTWRVHSVHNARYIHRLTNYRQRGQWVTIQKAATELGVSQTVISRFIREQTLPATQVVATTPWIIARQSLSLPAAQTEIEAVHAGRQLRRHDANQQELPFK